ncbi:MAG TPA: O-antigen ligase family protein [Gammaproteobacteria bacterium]|jgi:O-antigen ligase
MMQELRDCWQAIRAWLAGPAGESRLDRHLRMWVAVVVLLFPALCLLVNRSDSYCLLILLVVGVIAWLRNGLKSNFSRRDWQFAAVFVIFFLAGLLAFELGHQTDYGFRLLGRYMRLLLALPVLVAFKRYRMPSLLVWAGLGLGALVLGVDAIWERVSIAGFLQPDGDTNVAILFGDLATLTAFTFAAGYINVDSRLPRLGPWLMALGILGGLLACILSGARGAWLALPVLLVLFLACRHILRPRAVLIGAVTIVVLFGLLWLLPQARVRERILSTVRQIELYDDVQKSLQDEPAPACIDDPRLLEAWVAGIAHSPTHALRVNIEPAEPHGATGLDHPACHHGMILRLDNQDSDAVWVTLPRTPHSGQRRDHALLRLSGEANVYFGRGPESAGRVHPGTGYRDLQLATTPALGTRILLVLQPGKYLEIVPIEQFPGEYRYSMVQSSLGQRLQMWGVAWQMFKSAPLTGIGTAAYMDRAEQMALAGKAPPITAIYDHPHNEVLDALATRGVVGLAALLLLLGVPGWLFARGLNSQDPARMGASLAGLMVVVGFAVFGLTETMLVHSITLGWYAIMAALFLVTSEGSEGRGATAR